MSRSHYVSKQCLRPIGCLGIAPFPRGSVHLISTNASADLLINPKFFMLDWDAILQTAGAKMVRKAFHTAPLAEYTEQDSAPTLKEVGNDAGVKEWLDWFKHNCKSLVDIPCFDGMLSLTLSTSQTTQTTIL